MITGQQDKYQEKHMVNLAVLFYLIIELLSLDLLCQDESKFEDDSALVQSHLCLIAVIIG